MKTADTRWIVDSHAHIGESIYSGVIISEDELLAAMAAHEVDLALVMPQPFQRDEPIAIHDRIARLVEREPARVKGMVNISPLVGEAAFAREVRRCVGGLGFVALKIHPFGHTLAPNHPRARIVFEMARELSVPIIIHTGTGIPAALPALAIEPALAYPDVSVVLAHAGFAVYAAEAVVAAKVCPNILLEPSWCAAFQVADMVRAIGADRVLLGSDHLTNLPVELTKFRSIGLTDAQLQACLSDTARRVFRLPSRER